MTDFKEGQEVWVRCEFCEYAGANQAFVLIQGEGALAQLYDIKDSEPKKVTIPQFVADWIEYCKESNLTLMGSFEPVSEHGVGLAETFKDNVLNCTFWASRNQEIFARAWLDGYETEQEKLYTVEIPNPNRKGKNRIFLQKDPNTGKILLCKGNFNPEKNKNLWLTESEIKQDFAWAWKQGFAKEVE